MCPLWWHWSAEVCCISMTSPSLNMVPITCIVGCVRMTTPSLNMVPITCTSWLPKDDNTFTKHGAHYLHDFAGWDHEGLLSPAHGQALGNVLVRTCVSTLLWHLLLRMVMWVLVTSVIILTSSTWSRCTPSLWTGNVKLVLCYLWALLCLAGLLTRGSGNVEQRSCLQLHGQVGSYHPMWGPATSVVCKGSCGPCGKCVCHVQRQSTSGTGCSGVVGGRTQFHS